MSRWSTQDFEIALSSLGIESHSNIFVHSSLGMLGNHLQGTPASAILDCFETLFNREIQVYFPAFTYSLSENLIFDPNSDYRIIEMGALSKEAFLRNYSRTLDPIFSVLTNPKNSHNSETNPISSSFGPGSLFSRLVDENTFILNLGTGVGTTLLHEVERRLDVPYRQDKFFSGDMLNSNGNILSCSNGRSYVRDLNFEGSEADFRFLNKITTDQDFVSRLRFGKTEISIYRIQDMAKFIKNSLGKWPNLLNKRGIEETSLFNSY